MNFLILSGFLILQEFFQEFHSIFWMKIAEFHNKIFEFFHEIFSLNNWILQFFSLHWMGFIIIPPTTILSKWSWKERSNTKSIRIRIWNCKLSCIPFRPIFRTLRIKNRAQNSLQFRGFHSRLRWNNFWIFGLYRECRSIFGIIISSQVCQMFIFCQKVKSEKL